MARLVRDKWIAFERVCFWFGLISRKFSLKFLPLKWPPRAFRRPEAEVDIVRRRCSAGRTKACRAISTAAALRLPASVKRSRISFGHQPTVPYLARLAWPGEPRRALRALDIGGAADACGRVSGAGKPIGAARKDAHGTIGQILWVFNCFVCRLMAAVCRIISGQVWRGGPKTERRDNGRNGSTLIKRGALFRARVTMSLQ